MIVRHDDAEREYAYDRESHVGRLARALDEAPKRGWQVALDARRLGADLPVMAGRVPDGVGERSMRDMQRALVDGAMVVLPLGAIVLLVLGLVSKLDTSKNPLAKSAAA